MACNIGQAAANITDSVNSLRNTVEGIQGSARGIMDQIDNLDSTLNTQVGPLKTRIQALVPTFDDALDALGVPNGLISRARAIAAVQDPIQKALAIAELYNDYGPELGLSENELGEIITGGGDLCKLLPNLIQNVDGQAQKLGNILEAPEIDAVLDPKFPIIPDINVLEPILPDISGIFKNQI